MGTEWGTPKPIGPKEALFWLIVCLGIIAWALIEGK